MTGAIDEFGANEYDGYGLGLVRLEDERDDAYRMLLKLPEDLTAALRAAPNEMIWSRGPILNQSDSPHCTGFAWTQWLQTAPVKTLNAEGLAGNNLGHELYRQCKRIDGYSGKGTYIRVGAKVLDGATGWQDRVVSYLWAKTWVELMSWLLIRGPVVIGIPWAANWFRVGSAGLMPRPSSEIVGGHAILLVGANQQKQAVYAANSWGSNWANRGTCVFGRDAIEQAIFGGRGDACTAVEVGQDVVEPEPAPKPAPKPPTPKPKQPWWRKFTDWTKRR